ncbi:hypothetical protein GGI07_003143 [Coemansia sp. Benny D115]|nr:hypothetical protein GGI07_003143 [Coemansia sp. Benny D115]
MSNSSSASRAELIDSNEIEHQAFRIDVCGHQYSMPSDQADADTLDTQLWDLTEPFAAELRDLCTKVSPAVVRAVEEMHQARASPQPSANAKRRRRTAGATARRRTQGAKRGSLPTRAEMPCDADHSTLGLLEASDAQTVFATLQGLLDTVGAELERQGGGWPVRRFALAPGAAQHGGGVADFMLAGSDAAGVVGVLAPTADCQRPFASGLAEVLVAAFNRHARRQLNVRHGWALLVASDAVRLCLVESDAIHVAAPVDVRVASGRARVAQLLVRLGVGEPWRLGSDPTMRWDAAAARWAIECPGEDDDEGGPEARVFYAARQPLFTADSFFGRFTRVFLVSQYANGSPDAVLKDSWQLAGDAGENTDEISVLRHIRRQLERAGSDAVYPRLERGGTVWLSQPGASDTSDIVLGGASEYARWTVPHGTQAGCGLRRLHRRMVTGPVGTPLQTLATEHDVVTVLSDAMHAHAELLEHAGILHRDVSLNNIMAVRCAASGRLRGMLIDFDHAVDAQAPRNTHSPGHVGTGPFMSIANLEGLDVPRTAVDDWEAVLALLFCLAARSPQAMDHMGTRFALVSAQGVADVKREIFASPRTVDAAIAEHLDAAACPQLVRLIRALAAAIFQHPKCPGTARRLLRGNRRVDPVLRRAQYALDIQARCLHAVAHAAAEARSVSHLSDHLAAISHATPPRLPLRSLADATAAAHSPIVLPTIVSPRAPRSAAEASPTETLLCTADSCGTASKPRKRNRSSDDAHVDRDDDDDDDDDEYTLPPLSAKSDGVVAADRESATSLATLLRSTNGSLSDYHAPLYRQHSTAATLNDLGCMPVRSNYALSAADAAAVAAAVALRKRKAKEETQDSPRTKRRKMMHADDNMSECSSTQSLAPFATPASLLRDPQQPSHSAALSTSKLRRKLF